MSRSYKKFPTMRFTSVFDKRQANRLVRRKNLPLQVKGVFTKSYTANGIYATPVILKRKTII